MIGASRRWIWRACLGSMVALVFFPANDVFAKGPDARAKAEAQKLYEDGAKDLEADDYARACPKFEAAWKILPEHIRTGLTLADCFDKWGKPASALEVLEKVTPLAKAGGDQAKVAEIAASMVELDKRVPRLTLRVEQDIATMPGFALTRGGIPVPSAAWGTPMPMDPGEYEIEATAVERATWKKTVRLVAGHSETLEVTPNWEKPKVKTVVVLAPMPVWAQRVRMAGMVGIGLGAAGLGAWGVLGGVAISKNKASLAHCSKANLCDGEGFEQRKDAISFGHGATAGLIAGGVLATTGIAFVIIAASARKPAKREAGFVTTNLMIGPAALGLRGTW